MGLDQYMVWYDEVIGASAVLCCGSWQCGTDMDSDPVHTPGHLLYVFPLFRYKSEKSARA